MFLPLVGKIPTATHSTLLASENSMDCIVHGVVKRGTRLRDFHVHFYNVSSAQQGDSVIQIHIYYF